MAITLVGEGSENIDKNMGFSARNLAARWLEIGLRMRGIMNGEVRFHLLKISYPTKIQLSWADCVGDSSVLQ